MRKGEKWSAKAKDKQGGGKALSTNGNRQNQTPKSVCQPYSDQKDIQEKAGVAVRVFGSSDKSKRDQETDPISVICLAQTQWIDIQCDNGEIPSQQGVYIACRE